LVAPKANRFIFSHDVTNAKMLSLADFEAALTGFGADLIVLSGFHMLEGKDQQLRVKVVVIIFVGSTF
jgi:ADP-dependent glucokinase